ncbi:hypothetical protein [Lutibacter sp.]|uniref:hypothetical protein n=1 Tax=Lutibacter sp. TaxID=1925666 RepID=UPI003567C97B
MQLVTNFNPIKKHLTQIKSWLLKEYSINGFGFYSNWDSILKAFENKNLIVLTDTNKAIGFLVYEFSNFIVKIDIANLKSDYINKSYGRNFINQSLEKFKSDGALVCELFCAPESSEPIWKSLGFENFPSHFYSNEIKMFKPLVPTLQLSNLNQSKEVIALWDCEPYRTKLINPKWYWNLTFKENSRELLNPIIHPIHYDWQLSYKIEQETIFLGKIKYYNFNRIEFGNFIIIRELII